jgi:hypothetical protein
MSLPQTNEALRECPPALEDLRRQLHQRLDQAIEACQHQHLQDSFFAFEKALLPYLSALGLLLTQLFLLRRHQSLDLAACDPKGRYRVGEDYATRDLSTGWGKLRYGRVYLIPRRGNGSGFHPLDAQLGLTRDGFSPQLISWFCRLCTRVSFRLASELGGMFLGWAPAPSTLEGWALGLGRPAHLYLHTASPPSDDGEVLASGVVEGAARYVIGERLDNSGMRWIVERAEAVLLLRCIEVNGDWDAFFSLSEERRLAKLKKGKVMQIFSQQPTQLPQVSEKAEQARRRRKAKEAA